MEYQSESRGFYAKLEYLYNGQLMLVDGWLEYTNAPYAKGVYDTSGMRSRSKRWGFSINASLGEELARHNQQIGNSD